MGKNTENRTHGLNINMKQDTNAELPAKDSQSACKVIVQGMSCTYSVFGLDSEYK